MKVGVNLTFIVPGQVGGSEQYLARQLVGLVERPEVSMVLYVLPGFAEAHPELAAFEMAVAPVSGVHRAARVGVEATWLMARARRDHVDVLHHGGGTLPASMPFAAGPPAVLTVHDVQYLTFPQTFTSVKLQYLRMAVPRSVRRAAVVTVPSSFVAGTLQEAFGISPDDIAVVPHPLPVAELANRTAESDLRSRYGLPGPVVLYPAITYAHKNHQLLVQATAPLTVAFPDLRLVLLGAPGPVETDVMREVERLGIGGAVVRPGRVSDADRNGLMAMATACAFPSRYEGFGAPVLEAMVAGCPVVAADSAALPEVVGDAGLLLSPDEPEQWTDALRRLLEDEAERSLLRAAGRQRAAMFTPAVAADRLFRAYLRALS